jgi:hypothetical protein
VTPDSPLGCAETELCIRAQAHVPHNHFPLEPRDVMHHAVPAERASVPYFAALARAGAIVAGLTSTTTEFLKIRWTRPAGPPQEVGSTLRNFSLNAVAEAVLTPAIDVNSPLVGRADPGGQSDGSSPSRGCCW